MKQMALDGMTINQLVEHFTTLALEQDRALLRSEIKKVNQLGELMQAVAIELKQRDGDQRRALLQLYDHPNAQVRLKAVKATLVVAPDIARRMLQTIAESGEYPQAGDAGMSVLSLERGTYKPT